MSRLAHLRRVPRRDARSLASRRGGLWAIVPGHGRRADARSRSSRVPGGGDGRGGRGGGARGAPRDRSRRRLPHLPAASPSPSSGRCRSARSARPAGWRGSCASRPTASPATSTSSGPTSAQSQWFGGAAEGWERAPYWLDGAIPLAWILDDAPLKARIARTSTTSSPTSAPTAGTRPTPRTPPRSGTTCGRSCSRTRCSCSTTTRRATPACSRPSRGACGPCAPGLDRTPLYDWGRFRWYEGLVSAFYAYERTREPWLLDLARKLRAQGVDFEALYRTDDITVPTPRRGLWKWTKHVVNTAMATKAAALSWRLDQRPADRAFATRMIEILDRYHGQVTGMFSGDECLAGRNPLQGTELCSVVEFMYSLEHLFSVFGDPSFGDRLERVAFNALPATFAPDMWSHQYDQQVNQVQCTVNPDHLLTTNGPESNIYGLEPNFGCCTANMHQGWPKFAAHLWMKTPDEGLVAAAWAPCRVSLHLARRAGRRSRSRPTIRSARRSRSRSAAERPVRFPLVLRVPAWAEGATVSLAGGAAQPMQRGLAAPRRARVERRDRRWPCASRCGRWSRRATTRRSRSSAARSSTRWRSARRGRGSTRTKPHRELPHGDFEVRPTTPWNYGLVVDPARPEASLRFEERPVGDRPFSPEGAGMSRRGEGAAAAAGGRSRTAGRARSRAPTPTGPTPPRRSRTARSRRSAHPLRLHEHPHHGVPARSTSEILRPRAPSPVRARAHPQLQRRARTTSEWAIQGRSCGRPSRVADWT